MLSQERGVCDQQQQQETTTSSGQSTLPPASYELILLVKYRIIDDMVRLRFIAKTVSNIDVILMLRQCRGDRPFVSL
jgi:hypothetical protein